MYTYRHISYSCISLVILVFATLAAAWQLVTTATLTVSPASPVPSGTLLTLTAAVADTNGPVLHGTVLFYDGRHHAWSAQLVSGAAAIVKSVTFQLIVT